ncbi:MAG: YidC/Oxa1 family membrane protein insertase [Eubacterium sp.]|nr:YidC/Oxa1 family membrane protein insertase [Eubacterium sp.]
MFDWLYWIFGKILFGIDWAVYHTLGIHNTGLCIILLTIVIYLIMYPLNSKQQKSSRLMSKINPEIQAIQKKYRGKKDQASQMKMNEETQAIYAKYGISPFGGCLPLLITMPILFCLYRVMYDIKNYVPGLSEPSARYFLGLDVDMSPLGFFGDKVNHPYGWVAFIIPVLAVLLQFINSKLLQTNNNNDNADSMAQSMKMMNYFMPFMSGFFCLSLNMGIGLYWITGSLFRIVQAIIVNKKMDKVSMEELIEKNKDKAAKKNKKREEMNRQMEQYSKTKTASIKTASSYQNKPDNTTDRKVNVNKDIQPGSISGYANMLSGNKDKN